MADYLIGQGNLPASLAEQLESTDPGSVGYTALLNQAAAYESLLNPTAELDYQFINEIDGEPKVGKYDTSAADTFGKSVSALLWGTSIPAIADEGIGGSELEGAAASTLEAAAAKDYSSGAGAWLETNAPIAVAAGSPSTALQGGLNLFKWGQEATSTANGWRDGDYMLALPDQGSPAANWAQNSSWLRQEMRNGNPIYDSYRDPVTGEQVPTGGFLNAERNLLENHGWQYSSQVGAYLPPEH